MKTKTIGLLTAAVTFGASALHASLMVDAGTATLLLDHDGSSWLASVSGNASPPVPFAGLTLEMNDPLFREVDSILYRVTPAAGTVITNPMIPTEPEFVLQVGNLSGAGLINAILALNVPGSTFTFKDTAVALPLSTSGAEFIMYRDLPASNPTALSTASSVLAYSLISNSTTSFNLGFSEWGTYNLAFTLIGLDAALNVTTLPLAVTVVVPEPSTYALFFGAFALGLVVMVRRFRRSR